MSRLRTLLLVWITLGGTCGCASSLPQGVALPATSNYCEPAVPYAYPLSLYPQADINAVIAAAPRLGHRYSRHDLLLANAAGILPSLRELLPTATAGSAARRLQQLEVQQRILTRLLLASTEVNSMAAELDCEGERAEQLAYYLDEQERQRVKKYTLLSIIVGALTSVVTGFSSNGVEAIAGVTGGLGSAALGLAAADDPSTTVNLTHERNLLRDIWQQNTASAVYSPFVWYVLNEPLFSNDRRFSISHNLRQRWLAYLSAKSDSGQQQTLIFGNGGRYTAEELHMRAQMLNQLQASIHTLNQDLQSLMLSLSGSGQ